MKKTILILLLLSGCAAMGPKFIPETNISSDMALIYVYRKSSIVGAANEPYAFINSKHHTELLNGGYAFQYVKPGSVTIGTLQGYWGLDLISRLIEKQKILLTIDVEAGKTYYIQYKPVGGRMVLKDENIALQEMGNLRLLEFTEVADDMPLYLRE
jgi:hypothetical protein